MTTPAPPQIDCEEHFPALQVPDVAAAVEFYTTRLGFHPGFTWGDPPTAAGVGLDRVEVHLMQGRPSPDGCSVSFLVGDADELHAFHRAAGVDVVEPPEDRPWGLREYTVRDLNGYYLSFAHHLFNMGTPLEIERVDVPVRLERRLAALLHDLAAHKRMSLSSCLEEILLHTCEPVGDGVASPHTRGQLRHIQELKAKHGIDYDAHASYRFVER
jgi:catechol 2,3-dioxygenase-like lactoylglutathione lyase family enzyme